MYPIVRVCSIFVPVFAFPFFLPILPASRPAQLFGNQSSSFHFELASFVLASFVFVYFVCSFVKASLSVILVSLNRAATAGRREDFCLAKSLAAIIVPTKAKPPEWRRD